MVDEIPNQVQQIDELMRREAERIGKQGVRKGTRKFHESVKLHIQSAHAVDDGIACLADEAHSATDGGGKALKRVLLVQDARVEVVLATFGDTGLPETVSQKTADDGTHFFGKQRPVLWIVARMGVAQELEQLGQDDGEPILPQSTRCLIRRGVFVQLLD